jgi:hypothetical protein
VPRSSSQDAAEAPVTIALDAQLPQLETAGHTLVDVSTDGLREALEFSPVRLSTMGRGLDEDAIAFLASAAAGRLAAQRIGS